MNYRNLDLELSDYQVEKGAEQYSVRVLASPQGSQRKDIADAVVLQPKLRKRLRTLERGKLSLGEMISLGRELGDNLFPQTARWFLDQSRAELKEGERLRIRLRLETYALADLPWEYAYIPQPDTPPGQDKSDGFLVLDPCTSLVRYEVLGQPPGTLDPVGDGPLRMVVLLASPRVKEYHELDLEAELGNIQETLGDVPDIKIEPHMNTTRQILLDAVQEGHAHLFHFAGHGEFQGDQGEVYGTVEGEGFLVLEMNGKTDLFDADTLAVLLKDRGVRLAVLGACETGRRDGANAWTGIVPALSRAGIPAVVGNQYRIKDKNAITFSRSFYRTLVRGASIDAAVTDGRQAIFALSGAGDRDWGVPVLNLRAEDGVLFPQPEEVPPPPGDSEGDEGTRRDPPPVGEVDRTALRKGMVKHLGIEDLEALCEDIQVDLKKGGIDLQVSLDAVGGTSMTGRVLNLIKYLDRRGHLDYLVAALRRDWPDIM